MISGLTENEWIFSNRGLIFLKQLNVGDEVLSYNFETKQNEYKSIIKITKSQERVKIKRVILDLTTQLSKVALSQDYHLFKENGEPINVEKLVKNDAIICLKNESEIYIKKIDHITGTHYNYIFDIEIEDNAPFYAGKITPSLIQKAKTVEEVKKTCDETMLGLIATLEAKAEQLGKDIFNALQVGDDVKEIAEDLDRVNKNLKYFKNKLS